MLKQALASGERTLCISKQVIEASVDSVVQSAGRCNRSGELPDPQSVYLVECVDENIGKEEQYAAAKVHRSVHVRHCQEGEEPVVELDELPGLVPEVIDGI